MKLLKMLVGIIRDWRSRRVYERLSDEAVEEQLNKLTDNKYLDRFSGGSRDSKMKKMADAIGYLIGGILVSLIGVAIIAVLVKAILWVVGL